MSDNKRSEAFYEELISQDFYQNNINKTASSIDKNEAKQILEENFSPDQLEALAEEIDNMFMEKVAEEPSLENRTVEQPKEDKVNHSKRKTMEEELMSEDERIDTSEERDHSEVQSEDEVIDEGEAEAEQKLLKSALAKGVEKRAEENQDKEELVQKAQEIAKKIVAEATQEGTEEAEEETEEEENKTAAEYDEEVVKYAYDLAAQELEKEGMDLADYVSQKIEDKVAIETIVDKSEKLAYIAEKNSMQVADDIIYNIYSLLQE